MPTFKHPCPYCDELIARDAVACPYCGMQDPFAPKRCPTCRTPVEDPRWAACPRCGAALGVRPSTAEGSAAASAPAAEQTAPGRACAGCGAALPAGARFCLACGTLAG